MEIRHAAQLNEQNSTTGGAVASFLRLLDLGSLHGLGGIFQFGFTVSGASASEFCILSI